MRVWVIRIGLCGMVLGGMLLAQEHNAGTRTKTAGETEVPGDPLRGRAIFAGKGGCLSCHRVGDEGSRLGPNLSEVATTRSVGELQKALLDPGPTVDPQNQLYQVVTADGRKITGKLLNQDVYSLQMLDTKDQLLAFQKSSLRGFGFAPTPAMPSYRDKLTQEEQTDLIAYLASLRGAVKQ
ncbi:MAG: c-type cytochrome [Acidobacteriaceae bacterium]